MVARGLFIAEFDASDEMTFAKISANISGGYQVMRAEKRGRPIISYPAGALKVDQNLLNGIYAAYAGAVIRAQSAGSPYAQRTPPDAYFVAANRGYGMESRKYSIDPMQIRNGSIADGAVASQARAAILAAGKTSVPRDARSGMFRVDRSAAGMPELFVRSVSFAPEFDATFQRFSESARHLVPAPRPAVAAAGAAAGEAHELDPYVQDLLDDLDRGIQFDYIANPSSAIQVIDLDALLADWDVPAPAPPPSQATSQQQQQQKRMAVDESKA